MSRLPSTTAGPSAQSLFDTPAASRRSDPPSSRAAAERVTKSGRAATQRQQVLAALWRHPGATSAELSAAVGIERYTVSRRLPELRDMGLVRNGDERVCRINSSAALTWYIADAAPRSSAIPSVITPAMLDRIHDLFDRKRQPQLTGAQILLAQAIARAERIPDVITGAFSVGVDRRSVKGPGHRPAAEVPEGRQAGVRPAMHADHSSSGA